MFENQLRQVALLSLALFLFAQRVVAQQTPPVASSPNGSPSPTPPVFSPQTLSELKQLQQAALESDYAYRQVAHLANNIGPRLSGSAQATKAVEHVAAELKALGCNVQLEKVMVPHWVRGEETAALVQFPGQAPNTTQKIVLCALGGSVATQKNGIEAEILVVKNFDELKSMPREKVAGKICCSITHSTNKWPRRVVAPKLMAKRLFIAVTGRAQPRGKALLRV